LIGTIAAPLLYKYLHGYVIGLGGLVSLLGLVYAAPQLRKDWKQLEEKSPGR
jgi:hypothetical protein